MSEWGMAESSPQLKSQGVVLRWGLKIPLRDGVCLSAILYRLKDQAAPRPSILALTPYMASGLHSFAVYFASHGFPFLSVDVRGRGDSEGEFQHETDANDGYDAVEWLAEQEYCDGQVAMWGGSYLGYAQWATARERPPHLGTIVPVAAPYRGVDAPISHNLFSPYVMQWLILVSGRAAQERPFADGEFWRKEYRRWFESGAPFKKLDTFLGCPSSLFQEWISHPCAGTYWDRYNPTAEQYGNISFPILTITGAYDGDQLGALEHYKLHTQHASAEARARHYLVIGPWDHYGTATPRSEFCGLKVGPESLVDLRRLHLEWYAWALQEGPRPEFLKKQVAYYVMGAERWRYSDSLEAVTGHCEPLYLDSTENPIDVFQSGSLTRELPKAREPDQYRFDPRDVSRAELESQVDVLDVTDQRMVHFCAGRQLIYHSAPFEQDTELSGFFRLTLWLSIDQPDTTFCVSVHEIGLDGSAIRLTMDRLRARHRESSLAERLIYTTEPLLYEFTRFTFIARRISRGSRLRLIVGPLDSIYWQRTYNSGGMSSEESIEDARVVNVKLFHDEAHPSALHLPLGAERDI